MNGHTSGQDVSGKAQRRLSTPALIGVALVAGALAGAAILYVTGGLQGNGAPGLAAGGNVGGEACTGDPALVAAIEPHLTGDIAAMALRDDPVAIGDLAFNNADGEPVSLQGTGAGLKLVNLWATWCAPCREEMPYLDSLQAEKGSDTFSVVALSVDGGDDAKPKAFFEEIGISNLEFYQDPTIGAFNRLKRDGLAFGLPVTLLVDENDCVIANMNGPAHWASPDAFAMVDAALGALR